LEHSPGKLGDEGVELRIAHVTVTVAGNRISPAGELGLGRCERADGGVVLERSDGYRPASGGDFGAHEASLN